MLERHHLAMLREIDRTGSITLAADRLALSQSALSHAIRRLEDRLGAKLWERRGRRLVPTRVGTHLIGLAGRLLPQFEQAEATLDDFIRGKEGVLRIGMECHPCHRWLLKVVAPFFRAWPQVDVDIRQAFQFSGLEALTGHEIDLIVTPDPVRLPGLTYTAVFDYEMMLAVPEAHPATGPLAPDDLVGETLVTYPVDASRLDIFTAFLAPAGLRPADHKTIETTDIMLQMVAAGRGVAPLPDWLIAEYRRELPIRGLRLGDGIRKSIHVGAREEDMGIAYLAAFLDLARREGRRFQIVP